MTVPSKKWKSHLQRREPDPPRDDEGEALDPNLTDFGPPAPWEESALRTLSEALSPFVASDAPTVLEGEEGNALTWIDPETGERKYAGQVFVDGQPVGAPEVGWRPDDADPGEQIQTDGLRGRSVTEEEAEALAAEEVPGEAYSRQEADVGESDERYPGEAQDAADAIIEHAQADEKSPLGLEGLPDAAEAAEPGSEREEQTEGPADGESTPGE